MKSVLKDWVMTLGLRHQGVLLTAVRGCDTAPKDDASKLVTRCYRARVLNCHCGDPAKAVSFIQECDQYETVARMVAFRKNLDHYPHHYIMHYIHAAGIVGYNCPDLMAGLWYNHYFDLCKGLHMNPETREQMDVRLNADETTFAIQNDKDVMLTHLSQREKVALNEAYGEFGKPSQLPFDPDNRENH